MLKTTGSGTIALNYVGNKEMEYDSRGEAGESLTSNIRCVGPLSLAQKERVNMCMIYIMFIVMHFFKIRLPSPLIILKGG